MISHITESTQSFGTMENSPPEFSIENPAWTNASEFEQSVEVRTDSKSESGIAEGFPSMNISPGQERYTVFMSFLVSRLVSGYYPVLTDACILPC